MRLTRNINPVLITNTGVVKRCSVLISLLWGTKDLQCICEVQPFEVCTFFCDCTPVLRGHLWTLDLAKIQRWWTEMLAVWRNTIKSSFDSGNPNVSTFLSVPSIRPFSKRYQRLLIKHLMLPICFTRSRRRLLPWEDCGWGDLPVGPLLGGWP